MTESEYLENFTVSERDMTKYIIGTISNIDQPMTPATKGDRSMNLYMNHVSAEMIRKEREEILRPTRRISVHLQVWHVRCLQMIRFV